jgi:hypothetical protein
MTILFRHALGPGFMSGSALGPLRHLLEFLSLPARRIDSSAHGQSSNFSKDVTRPSRELFDEVILSDIWRNLDRIAFFA